MYPVCGPVTSSEKAILDEGFEQYGSYSIALIPLFWQLACDACEQAGGEIRALNPGQDQLSGLIDDPVQIGFPLLGIPANVLIPGELWSKVVRGR